jgi:hypothetical protein
VISDTCGCFDINWSINSMGCSPWVADIYSMRKKIFSLTGTINFIDMLMRSISWIPNIKFLHIFLVSLIHPSWPIQIIHLGPTTLKILCGEYEVDQCGIFFIIPSYSSIYFRTTMTTDQHTRERLPQQEHSRQPQSTNQTKPNATTCNRNNKNNQR